MPPTAPRSSLGTRDMPRIALRNQRLCRLRSAPVSAPGGGTCPCPCVCVLLFFCACASDGVCESNHPIPIHPPKSSNHHHKFSTGTAKPPICQPPFESSVCVCVCVCQITMFDLLVTLDGILRWTRVRTTTPASQHPLATASVTLANLIPTPRIQRMPCVLAAQRKLPTATMHAARPPGPPQRANRVPNTRATTTRGGPASRPAPKGQPAHSASLSHRNH